MGVLHSPPQLPGDTPPVRARAGKGRRRARTGPRASRVPWEVRGPRHRRAPRARTRRNPGSRTSRGPRRGAEGRPAAGAQRRRLFGNDGRRAPETRERVVPGSRVSKSEGARSTWRTGSESGKADGVWLPVRRGRPYDVFTAKSSTHVSHVDVTPEQGRMLLICLGETPLFFPTSWLRVLSWDSSVVVSRSARGP